MELEGPRFLSSSRKFHHGENFISSHPTWTAEPTRKFEDGEEEISVEHMSTLTNVGDSSDEIYILQAHSQWSPSNPPLVDPNVRPMKLALDDDTPLTGMRGSNEKFRIAYCPRMISSLVLESIESLLGDSGRNRRKRWHRKVASIFRSMFCSSSPRSEPSVFENSADWLLHRLYMAVSGSSAANSIVKWYATFISDTNVTPVESRLIVVAICFDICGSIAHVCGITSSKSAFRVLES